MSFISQSYALLIVATVGIYWFLGRSLNLKWGILLAVSLIFYASLQIYYLPLLLGITWLNFWLGKIMENNVMQVGVEAKNPQLSNRDWEELQDFWQRRTTKILCVGIVINVLLLLGFKYIPFILNSLAALLNLPQISQSASWLSENLIAPLGISFFTFECIAYLIDVYRGAPASRHLLQFTSYKLFFPKLISGPITRYHNFSTQANYLQFPNADQLTEGLWLIACGAVKKALIADHLAIFVDLAFGNLERAGSGDLWLAVLAYGLQLYFDFSGYVDLACGSALLLGFKLPQNFNFPYFSSSIAAFWRRWHITLGDWLRNYLYFPLGGSRQGLAKTCLNLLIVMLIAGIWHGAAWGYIVWGIVHGIALVIHRLTETMSQRWQLLAKFWQTALGILLAWLLTQAMVFFSWIFFRLPNLSQATLVLQHFWSYGGDVQFTQKVYQEAMGLERYHVTILVFAVVLLMNLTYWSQQKLKLQLNWPLKLALVPLCLFAVSLFAPQGGLPYIYFDF